MRHTQRREWQAEWKIGEARQAGEGGNGGFSSCGYSKHSVHSKRVTYWTGCLFLCLSVSFKQLCAMLNRNPALLRLLLVSSFFLVWSPFFLTSLHLPSCHLLSPPLLLVVISSLSPGSEYCTPWPPPPPSPSLFLSPSLLLLPCFPIFHSLSLSPCEEGKQHQRLSHSNSTCNRVQAAPSASPPSSLTLAPCQRKDTEKRKKSTGVKPCRWRSVAQQLRRRERKKWH